MEDCLQEAYFGLWEAVKRYETSENVLFMTYAGHWIKQSVQRYIEKCGAVVKIPSHTRQKIACYKKAVEIIAGAGESSKSELWGIVEHYTGERENHIIKK